MQQHGGMTWYCEGEGILLATWSVRGYTTNCPVPEFIPLSDCSTGQVLHPELTGSGSPPCSAES
jgi:hypothetical protein